VVSPARLFTVALLVATLLAAAGYALELATFGFDTQATAARLEREVRRTVAERTADLERLAARVSAEASLIAAAATDPDRVPELFDRLNALALPVGPDDAAATIYVPRGAGNTYLPLAWSRGSGASEPTAERLAAAPALYVAPGHAGMGLIATRPIDAGTQRLAVVVAETVLAPNDRTSTSPEQRIMTSLGGVSVIEQYASTRDDVPPPNGFLISGQNGVPLLEVRFDPEELRARRLRLRSRVLAVALLPLVIAAALLVPRALQSAGGPGRAAWARSALRASGWIAIAGGLLAIALWIVDASPPVWAALAAALLVGLAATVAGSWWWRPRKRQPLNRHRLRFAAEQVLAGACIAGSIEAASRGLAFWIQPDTLDRWSFVLFPFDRTGVVSFVTLLLLELALAWTLVLVVATLADRWNLRSRGAQATAFCLWALPSMALLAWPGAAARMSLAGSLTLLVCALAFARVASELRHFYRRTTQSMKLLLGTLALAIPLVAFYPLGASTADRATQHLIAGEYAPATADRPRQMWAELKGAQEDIDRFTPLSALVSAPPSSDTKAAFLVWSQTNLSRTRVISDVELYGEDGSLVSRFAFNLPEYLYRTTQSWQASSCDWDVFGEVAAFGAEAARLMLHAMRGVCDAHGQPRGGIVVHVASHDYQALPFVASANPYNALVGEGEPPDSPRVPGLAVAVYGWSHQPNFTSGPTAWTVPPDILDRLYNPGTPFWTSLEANGLTYRVHFSQNRAGIYALGYPNPTWFTHATRLAEMLAVAAVLFVLLQIGAAVSSLVNRKGRAPLGQLFHEIRTSFYRKLFLFFVAVAIAPVLIFAVVFGSYMTARFRADVESEARTTVTVARRVFEELAAAEARIGAPSPDTSDDVMVWIRQAIGQDVNLFRGSQLDATSQRDLFDSGLLPIRTPADVHQGIVLQRLPTTVVEDRVGDFTYLIAATGVPALGRDAVLTVPLAPRQRDIERQADELYRGVLVGSVLVVLLAAGLGASLASRISDPVARLTRATRQIAAGELDVRITADTADELRRLVDDFNSMAETLARQRGALARTNQLKAWNEMARQVAHEIKNPLTPIQLAAEHLQHVHADRGRPLGTVMDQCLTTILGQVRLLRQIASEFSTFAGEPTPRPVAVNVADLLTALVDPYRTGLGQRVVFDLAVDRSLPAVWADRTLLSRAFTNLVENAVQAMPGGGTLHIRAAIDDGRMQVEFADTGVGMDAAALERAFEPYFSTKTGGSGLGLANARRNIEISGGRVAIASQPGVGTVVTVSLPLASLPDANAGAS
jgi:signal transduction histidine kinase